MDPGFFFFVGGGGAIAAPALKNVMGGGGIHLFSFQKSLIFLYGVQVASVRVHDRPLWWQAKKGGNNVHLPGGHSPLPLPGSVNNKALNRPCLWHRPTVYCELEVKYYLIVIDEQYWIQKSNLAFITIVLELFFQDNVITVGVVSWESFK